MFTSRPARLALLASTTLALPLLAVSHAHAQFLTPGDIIVSSSTYSNVGLASTSLTAGSQIAQNSAAAIAVSGGGGVNGNPLGAFFNHTVDANFGVTSPLVVTQYTPGGTANYTLAFPAPTSTNTPDGIVTSFSSKSEGALTLSPDGKNITLMGYSAPLGAIDVSNTQTPGAIEAGNTDIAPATYRTAATINSAGQVTYTQTNSYSGNNARAAVVLPGNNLLMIGNAGNGNGGGVINNGTGVQYTTLGTTVNSVGGVPAISSVGTQAAPIITYGPGGSAVGFFQNAQVGATPDKISKDSNFRGLTVFNGTVYTTKGSGGNGIDTVYQVGNAGSLVTLPPSAAPVTGNPLASNNPITILPGLPAGLAANPSFTPFSTWFANPTTMYVSDEGSGNATDVSTNGGLEKWSLVNGTWVLDYTLRGSLIGASSTFASFGTVTTTGLRQINGVVNANGTVTIFGVTAVGDSITYTSPNGVVTTMDNGADPNQVVSITDQLAATTLPTGEDYTTFLGAQLGTVYRGVDIATPEPASMAMFGSALASLVALRRRRRS